MYMPVVGIYKSRKSACVRCVQWVDAQALTEQRLRRVLQQFFFWYLTNIGYYYVKNLIMIGGMVLWWSRFFEQRIIAGLWYQPFWFSKLGCFYHRNRILKAISNCQNSSQVVARRTFTRNQNIRILLYIWSTNSRSHWQRNTFLLLIFWIIFENSACTTRCNSQS